GADPKGEEPVKQLGQDGFAVVYAAQKDSLAAEGDACVGQYRAGPLRVSRKFGGMVEMNIYEQRVELRKHSRQFRSDPVGKSAGDPAPDSDYLHMPQLPQPAQNLPKMLRGKQKRVAARQEHVVDLFVSRDVVQGRRKVRGR